MKTREEVLDELERLLPWSCEERGGIYTIDQLRGYIDGAEYKGEPIDAGDFVKNRMQWGYCSKCRQLLDGGYIELDNEEDYKWLEENGDLEGAKRMRAYKKTHPSCKFLCWDCLDAYEKLEKVRQEIFGEVCLYDLDNQGLERLLGNCNAKIRAIKDCTKEVNELITDRKIRKRKEQSRKEWVKIQEEDGEDDLEL